MPGRHARVDHRHADAGAVVPKGAARTAVAPTVAAVRSIVPERSGGPVRRADERCYTPEPATRDSETRGHDGVDDGKRATRIPPTCSTRYGPARSSRHVDGPHDDLRSVPGSRGARCSSGSSLLSVRASEGAAAEVESGTALPPKHRMTGSRAAAGTFDGMSRSWPCGGSLEEKGYGVSGCTKAPLSGVRGGDSTGTGMVRYGRGGRITRR